ncbi:MAG: TIGR02594 family protein [Pseudolabrys sp.]|nr:TIGR02594 family protein [Pseudolabrys sp.]MDP2298286.1 TIGR02594 family protein [Pseudolabrys sp.]
MMKRLRRRATLLLCAVMAASFASSAMARPVQKATKSPQPMASAQDPRSPDAQPYPMEGVQASAGTASTSRSQRAGGERRAHSGDAFGGFTSNSLVSEARKYLGTNPTGRATLWCGAFMDLVLKRTGHKGGGNLASAYAGYGARVSGPQVGAIAVMRRGGGGHVGVVSGVDPNGNPIIVSGNHNRTVAESVYPRGRITAYVLPAS